MAKEPKRTYYIYCHTAPNGKRYIGQTCQKLRARWSNGHGYRENTHFYNAIQKYGWDSFEHTVLAVCSTKSDADRVEQFFIRHYDTFNRDKGYNQTLGGGGNLGRTPSEEERKRLSEKQKGRVISPETRAKISASVKKAGVITHPSQEARERMSELRSGKGNTMYGKHHSEDAKARIAEASRSRPRTELVKQHMREAHARDIQKWERPVVQLDKEGNEVARFRSLKVAQEMTGIFASNIGRCCREKHYTAHGYYWRYQDEYDQQLKSAENAAESEEEAEDALPTGN